MLFILFQSKSRRVVFSKMLQTLPKNVKTFRKNFFNNWIYLRFEDCSLPFQQQPSKSWRVIFFFFFYFTELWTLTIQNIRRSKFNKIARTEGFRGSFDSQKLIVDSVMRKIVQCLYFSTLHHRGESCQKTFWKWWLQTLKQARDLRQWIFRQLHDLFFTKIVNSFNIS